ncbi:hypothetical protein KEM56_005159, partial [Ascosphaera pollenicola]
LTPQLLKNAVSFTLQRLLAPIQEKFLASKEWQEIEKKAYPPPPSKVEKKAKKPKNKGSKYPGAAKAATDGEKPTDTKEVEEGLEKIEVKE